MATKQKLSDVIREINENCSTLSEELAEIRRSSETFLSQLRRQELQLQQEQKAREAEKRAEEEKAIQQKHMTAWTMDDDELSQTQPETPQPEVVLEKPVEKEAEEKPTEKQEEKPVSAAEEEQASAQMKEQTAPSPAKSETQEKKASATANKTVAPQQPSRPQQPVKPSDKQQNRDGRNRAAAQQNGNGFESTFGQRPGYTARPQQAGRYGDRNSQQRGSQNDRSNGQSYAGQRTQNGQRSSFAGNGNYAPRQQGGQRAPYAGRQEGDRSQSQNGRLYNNSASRSQTQGNRPGSASSRSRAAAELAPVLEKERVSNYDPNKKQYIRQHDPERVAKNRKQLVKDTFLNGEDDDIVRGGKRSRMKKPSAQQLMAPIKIDTAYMTAETITVKDLTERIGKPAGEILKKLLLLGIMANINSELDFDTASLVCAEFDVTLEMKLDKTAEDVLQDINTEDKDEDLLPRPPVITIMGHVDHGKTSILDTIRKAHVTDTEAGGITQHIGAYTVNLEGRQITFLDTPGHEAFTAMRMRGAQATDIAVLVVAADDGVMPQTVEAINHAKAADVPIIVAINKMDKQGADPERIKEELTKYELVPEEWGGDTIMVPVSALTGEGIQSLLESILLQADVMELKANPNRMASGIIIEAKLDKARGPVATVLLQSGTLKIGDNIIAGTASGRVRAMNNDRGERVKTAGPSDPVEITGFNDVPLAGDELIAVADDHLGRQVAQERRDKIKASRTATAKVSLDNLFANISEGKVQTLNVIVKADVQGSVEAVKQAMEKLSGDEVKVHVLHSAVGAITQDDVNLASAFNAIIIGFNIRPDNAARTAAEKEGVDIRLYRIIYQAIEDIEKAMKGMLEPVTRETLLGHAQVRNVFKVTGAGTIAGSYITDGKVQRNAQVRLLRDNVVIFEGKLSSLRRFKDDVREVNAGYECGIGLENYNDVKENDVIECFILEQVTEE